MGDAVNIEDLRRRAKRKLPRALFDFVDGGAMDEKTLRANRDDFGAFHLLPKALVDVGARSQATSVLGQELATPIVLSPTGMTGLFGPGGEIAAARAARAAGAGYCVSTMASTTIEDLAAALPADQGGFWFQLYIQRDRGVTKALVERAAAAGCPVLAVTVDTVVTGRRERDTYNGYTIPLRITPRNAFEVLLRPGWLWRFLTGPKLTFANFVGIESRRFDITTVAGYIAEQFDPSVTWKDIDWLRSFWPGKLIVKGIVNPEDARLARDHGCDGLSVSNHGGRQLDSTVSAIAALPAVVDAVGDDLEVLIDGGIRRGTDVVKALALGARACLIGRPFLYGLAAGGEAGVGQALAILRDEIDNVQALLGCPDLEELDRSFLSGPESPWPANR